MIDDERAKIEFEIREQLKAERRAYKAEWRKKNPDKVKAANERYWRNRTFRELKERGVIIDEQHGD